MPGPNPISMPSGGGVQEFSARTDRDYHLPISMPSGGGVQEFSLGPPPGWHIGSLRFGSTAVAGGAFTGWT